jgi:predicted lipoprotein with Yx(FWY)xxD motif
MPKPSTTRAPVPYPIRTPILTLAIMIAMAALIAASASAAAGSKPVAREAANETLGKTVLTTIRGHTLYSLSVERKGKFICANAGCLASWRPLVVAKGVKPTGPVRLGTVIRPDGRRQVTYKGLPLYSFNGDVRKGEVNGEGIRDVGTWHAAVTGPLRTQTTPQPQTESPNPSPYPSETRPPFPY